MRKVFTEELPRWRFGKAKINGDIDWINTIGSKVKFIYNEIQGEVTIMDYEVKKHYLFLKYNKKENFRITTGDFQLCKLGKMVDAYTHEFKAKIGDTFKNNKRDLTIIDREYRKDIRGCDCKFYKYTCNKCGYDKRWISESSLILHETGCACCGINSKVVGKGINDIPTTAPWMITYFQGGVEEAQQYTRQSNQKIIFKCPDCGRVKDKTIMVSTLYKEHGISCVCSDGKSYAEKFTFNMLEQLKIIFTNEEVFDWSRNVKNEDEVLCGYKKYDFYIDSLNCILEIHGEQHYKENRVHWTKTFEQEHKNDILKKDLALENGIKKENYIVINCKKSELEWIKSEMLKSRLEELFDLSIINWEQCSEFAVTNLVKIASEYKKNDIDLTTTQIGLLMKLDVTTIIDYLKKGNELNWCHYNSKEEMRKNSIKNGKLNGVQVEIFDKEGKSLGIFPSCAELSRQSEKLFGTKLQDSHMHDVCHNKAKHHKGYTFKYVA